MKEKTKAYVEKLNKEKAEALSVLQEQVGCGWAELGQRKQARVCLRALCLCRLTPESVCLRCIVWCRTKRQLFFFFLHSRTTFGEPLFFDLGGARGYLSSLCWWCLDSCVFLRSFGCVEHR